jgi:hypothetical protein
MKIFKTAFYVLLCVSAVVRESTAADEVSVAELFEPRLRLEMKPTPSKQGKVEQVGTHWRVEGDSPLHLTFIPEEGKEWDLTGHRLAGLRITNQDGGIVTIRGKLQNNNSTGWSHHAVGFCVAPSGEEATLGFPFPVPEDRYEGPEVFKDQLGKANGHRLHWRVFHPDDVRSLALELRSSTGKVNVLLGDFFASWPASAELDAKLNAMPYLDTMGQVRAVNWPGKAVSIDEAKAALQAEYEAASRNVDRRRTSTYGGWIKGATQKATGRFRTEKVDGKWWLIDPEGQLFFSVGACMASNKSETLVHPKRRDSGYFAFIPDKEDPLRSTGLRWDKGQQLINFPTLNYARFFGKGWEDRTRGGDLDRMQTWGLNTLGCWSDEAMQKDHRMPYTLIASPWWRSGNHNAFPSPFSEDFESKLGNALQKILWAKDDPWLLGVFLGNELEWPDEITPMLFDEPTDPATKAWAIAKMKQKYVQLSALNSAWKTQHADWESILTRIPANEIPKAVRDDLEPLYVEFASTFFRRCKATLEGVLPGTLYLGCRTHRGPKLLGKAAVGHVDVFSVNVYDPQVRANQLAQDEDMPIISSEFHFGAVDRGIPSPGLVGVWDQRQRGLAFAHYLASALADPRFVGVHWFQWLDQCAAGRPDRENHAVGFVDITGRAHREFVETVSKANSRLYEVRGSKQASVEKTLMDLLQPETSGAKVRR